MMSPRGTMDEVVRLVPWPPAPFVRMARPLKIVPPRLRPPIMGLGADSRRREPAKDIDTAAVDSLKALDPDRPIREGTSRISDMKGVPGKRGLEKAHVDEEAELERLRNYGNGRTTIQ